jgi:hypothetical protein
VLVAHQRQQRHGAIGHRPLVRHVIGNGDRCRIGARQKFSGTEALLPIPERQRQLCRIGARRTKPEQQYRQRHECVAHASSRQLRGHVRHCSVPRSSQAKEPSDMPSTGGNDAQAELHQINGALDVLFTLREEFATWLEEAQSEERKEELDNVYRHVEAMEQEYQRRREVAQKQLTGG